MHESIIEQLKADRHLLTTTDLRAIYPMATIMNINRYIGYINAYFLPYNIVTPLRQCMFLAQIGHESGQLRYCEEIASGRAYEGRKDLGNIYPGDGIRHKGRALIQVTGRANYEEISRDFKVDFLSHPEKLCEPDYAVRAAFWFWQKRNLNKWADQEDINKVTEIINGGLNGLADRIELYNNAKKVLL